jgi:hypothetical protein
LKRLALPNVLTGPLAIHFRASTLLYFRGKINANQRFERKNRRSEGCIIMKHYVSIRYTQKEAGELKPTRVNLNSPALQQRA